MKKSKLNYGNGFDDSNSIAIVWSIAEVKMVIEMFGLSMMKMDTNLFKVVIIWLTELIF